MGGSSTKEKPKDKEKKDLAKTLKFIQTTLDGGANRLDLNNKHLRDLPLTIEGKRDALKWLSVSHNELKVFPDVVCQFVNLVSLRINGNQLSSLPDNLTTLSALQVLDISKNRFVQWERIINSMAQLTDINLQYNQLTQLPPDFGSLTALRYLNLYINRITSFDVDWSALSNLTSLDISFNGLKDDSLTPKFVLPSLTMLPLCGNKLSTIPRPILELPSLKNLDLHFNNISHLPDNFGAMASTLRSLKLCNNALHQLPSSLSQLSALEEMDLSSNSLEALDHIGSLPKLTSLQVYWNKLKSLPEDIGNLSELKEIYMTENAIEIIPDSLSKLKNLRNLMLNMNHISILTEECIPDAANLSILNVSYNHLSALPESISRLTTLSKIDARSNMIARLPNSLQELGHLSSLDLGDNSLSIMPPLILEITTLTQLNLFSNGIATIPPAISNLKSLLHLNLSFNQLSSLPKEFTSLITITHLRLDGNFFKEFPEQIVALTNLKDLAIGSNRSIKEIPVSISDLKNLVTFQASSNQISSLPDTFVEMTSLTELDLSHNRLLYLPDNLDNLKALSDLDISGNALTSIPPCFGNMNSLKQVKASFNPHLTDVPIEYLRAQNAWISCTGNSKIEAEYYFSSKKSSDKSGRWGPIEEEDVAPIEPSPLPTLPIPLNPAPSSSNSPAPVVEQTPNPTPPSTPSSPSPLNQPPTEDTPAEDDEVTGKPRRASKKNSISSGNLTTTPKDKDNKDKDKSKKGKRKSIEVSPPNPHEDRRTIIDEEDLIAMASNAHSNANTPSNSGKYSGSDKPKDKDKDKDKKKDKPDKDKTEKDKSEKDKKDTPTSLSEHLVSRTPQVGWSEMRGSRPDMQDSLVILENYQNFPDLTLLGLFDGHGGTESALLASKKLPSLILDVLRTVFNARSTEFSTSNLVALAVSDLQIIMRATFMALHGAVAKAGYTDGTAATVALICHHYGESVKTETPSKENWSTNNLNVIKGDENYGDTPVASWCEKGKAAQLLLTHPPISASSQAEHGDSSDASNSEPKQRKRNKTLSNSGGLSTKRSLILLGNCGDQRAVMCRKGQAFVLTEDHKPEKPSEIARISLAGGFVAESRRVNGLLALSRAIGDVSVQPHVTFEPDILVVEVTEHDEFIIVACDGVWDVMSSQQAVNLALTESSPSRAANRIREYAFSLGSTDNISVIVYQLKSRERSNLATCSIMHSNDVYGLPTKTHSSPITTAATASASVTPVPPISPPSPRGSPRESGDVVVDNGSTPPNNNDSPLTKHSPHGKKRKKTKSSADGKDKAVETS